MKYYETLLGFTNYDSFYEKVVEKDIAYRDKQLAKQTKDVDPYDLMLLFKE